MRKFPRWMHPEPARDSILGWFVVIAIYAAFWAFLMFGHLWGRRHMRGLASERTGEDIGTFARAFDRRAEPFDPWVLRATWEALGFYATIDGRQIPLRPEDDLVEDLEIDPDDIDCLFCEVAARSGHSLENGKTNPYYGRVKTVGDFVRTITVQPC